MRSHILSIFLVILCFDANAETILLPDFTIEIPKGWVKATQEELRAMEEKERTVSGTSNYYSFGVQPAGKDAFFLEPPFILGYFKPDQSPSAKDMAALASQFNKVLDSTKMPENFGSDSAVMKNLFSKTKFGKPYYDSVTNCVWSTFSSETPGFGLLHALTISRLSPYGKVVMSAYVTDATKDQYVGVINQMASSIVFTKSLQAEVKSNEALHTGYRRK